MIILGIDPGTATTGFGIIKTGLFGKKRSLSCIKYGVIKTSPKESPEKRLKKLYTELSCLIKKYKPSLMAVERVYFFKNLKTAIPVSEAKGVILLTAAKNGLSVKQITPLQVKAGVCGYGRATKEDVQKIVKKILKLKEIPKPDDAADALAIAIYFCKK